MRPSKYGARRTGGYDSKREAMRAQDLRLLERAGVISNLREQVKLELLPKQDGERAAHWVADFVYRDNETGEEVWEDCKGFLTPEYRLKRKLVLFRHGIKIKET